jgi:RHS repeat-associated protein
MTECHDYLPFGRLLGSSDNTRNTGCYPANPTQLTTRLPQKFTGKERDAETNLDYFGARYYSGAQGRFMVADSVSGIPENPQSWNKYAYTFNNPLRYVDPNGNWPTPIHDALIVGAFGSRARGQGLSEVEVGWIQRGSALVDYSLFGQSRPSYAYEHGMRAPWETDEKATVRTDTFIREHEADAQQSLANGWKGSALVSFGRAIHPVMDRTSPAHTGEQVFGGVPSNPLNLLSPGGITREILGIYSHSREESKITMEQFRRTVDELRKQYLKTFGLEAFKKATGCTRVEGCEYNYTGLDRKYRKDQ